MIELLKVSNGTADYPGDFTPEEIKIIHRSLSGRALHLFSGCSKIGHVRVDFSCKEATLNQDVFKYLSETKESFDIVILDPPYNKRFADRYQKIGETPDQFIIFANAKKTTELFNLIEKNIKPSKIIMKSWNYYVPRNFRENKCFVCYAGGYRKPTFLMICDRKQNPLDVFITQEVVS